MSSISDHEHLDCIGQMQSKLSDSGELEDIQQHILRWIDHECKEQVNAGNYDSAVSLQNLQRRFYETFVTNKREAEYGNKIDITHAFPGEVSNQVASKLLFQYLIDELEEDSITDTSISKRRNQLDRSFEEGSIGSLRTYNELQDLLDEIDTK